MDFLNKLSLISILTGFVLTAGYLNAEEKVITEKYPDGKLKSEITYKGEVLHGPLKTYFKNGKLKEEGSYSDGRKNGTWKTYYPDGKVSREYTYEKGKTLDIKRFSKTGRRIDIKTKFEYYKKQYIELNKKKDKNGIHRILNPDGSVYIEMTYKDNKLNGPFKRYGAENKIIHETVFKDGKDISPLKQISKTEKPVTVSHYRTQIQTLFKNGKKPDGPVKIYFEDGTVMKDMHFKDGKLHGKVKTYYSNGAVKLVQTYNNGIETNVRQYSKDGKLISTKTSSGGK